MPEINCRYFSGYKPCGLNEHCVPDCPSKSEIKHRILIVHLGALGAVVRGTSLLNAIHRKYSNAHVTWVTQAPAHRLLQGHALIDRVLTISAEDQLILSALEFDVGFCIDKSLVAAGVINKTTVRKLYGFKVDANSGTILPATGAAEELWGLGISDFKKFFINKKPETQLMCESLELDYRRDDYHLELNPDEIRLRDERKKIWSIGSKMIVGINTGCSPTIPYKKLSVNAHRTLVKELLQMNFSVVLLGGPEDTLRNKEISNGLEVINSSTESGLRDGYISVSACDIVITGDSLGMHMGIAAKKWIVAWFGPTCAHEIDLYDRGIKVLSSATCSPCWKRSCQKSLMCYDLVDLGKMLDGVKQGVHWLMSTFKQPSSEICCSPSQRFDACEKSTPNAPSI